MRHIVSGVAVGLFAFCVVGGEALAFSVSYNQTVFHRGMIMASKVVIKDQMFRIEFTGGAGSEESVIIRNDEGIFQYLPADGLAVRLSSLEKAQQPLEALDDYAAYLDEHQAELIGAEIVNGITCDVYRFTNPDGAGLTTTWVWRGKQFPVRVELGEGEERTVVELTHIRLDVTPHESAFQLPANVQIIDVDGGFALE